MIAGNYESLLADITGLVMAHSNKEIELTVSHNHLAEQIGEYAMAYVSANGGYEMDMERFADTVARAVSGSPLDYDGSPFSPEHVRERAREYWLKYNDVP